MPEAIALPGASAAFRLMIATSWLASDSWAAHQERAIRDAIAAGPDWVEYLSLVTDRHRTPALSATALGRIAGLPIPQAVRQKLQEASDGCRMQAVTHCMLLAEVFKTFNRAGILAMPYKGPNLSQEMYGDPGLRQSRDLDLAVHQADVFKARTCLEEIGWKPDSDVFALTPRQLESSLRHEYDFVFVHARTGCILEVHWRNKWDTPALTRARWERSSTSHWQRCSFQAMSPYDTALYLCSHGGLHLWSRAKWLGDLAGIHASGLVDWNAAWHEATHTGQERVLLTGLRLVEQLYGLPMPVLAENGVTDLPPALLQIPLQALKDSEEAAVALGGARYRLRISRYERLLWPRKDWRESLAKLWYHREDFRTLPLPDGLFWAYIPLRPFLFLWRHARKFFSRAQFTPAAKA